MQFVPMKSFETHDDLQDNMEEDVQEITMDHSKNEASNCYNTYVTINHLSTNELTCCNAF
jgi:hypothetical protein